MILKEKVEPDLLNNIKRKRRAWTRYLSTMRNSDFLEYKRVRNEVNDTVKKKLKLTMRKV